MSSSETEEDFFMVILPDRKIPNILIVLLAFVAGVLLGQSVSILPQSVMTTDSGKVSLMVDFGDGEVHTYTDTVSFQDTTVFELLEEHEPTEYEMYEGVGVFVKGISGKTNDAERFWQYWVNNQYAMVGADQYLLSAGDNVEWKLIQTQPIQ